MKRHVQWKAMIDGPLRQSALEAASSVAQRLSNPFHTEAIAKLAAKYTALWIPFSVTHGEAALALLYGQMERCFPNENWGTTAHSYLTTAARSLESTSGRHYFLGLFGGVTGLCFTTYCLSNDGTRYQRLLATLDHLLVEQICQAFNPSEVLPGEVWFNDYDLTGGPSGIAAYLLLRQDVLGVRAALDSLLERLLLLSEWQGDRLGFFIPANQKPHHRHSELYPRGATDCGLAHGVLGPLALLSLAHSCGIEKSGLPEAIRRLADWTIEHRYYDEWGMNWPYAVEPAPFVAPVNAGALSEPTTRASWCYGSPGVARALWLAGNALQDPKLQEVAIESMRAVHRRPPGARKLDSSTLCHGKAGLLQIVLRFANELADSNLRNTDVESNRIIYLEMANMANELTQQLLQVFEPNSLVGFRDIEPSGSRVDNPGLLQGAAGVALALLAAATDVEPKWDRMFLLS